MQKLITIDSSYLIFTCRWAWSISAWPSCSIIRLHTVDCEYYRIQHKQWANILATGHIVYIYERKCILVAQWFTWKFFGLLTFPEAVPPATPIRNGVLVSLGDALPFTLALTVPFPFAPFVDGIKSGPLDIIHNYTRVHSLDVCQIDWSNVLSTAEQYEIEIQRGKTKKKTEIIFVRVRCAHVATAILIMLLLWQRHTNWWSHMGYDIWYAHRNAMADCLVSSCWMSQGALDNGNGCCCW